LRHQLVAHGVQPGEPRVDLAQLLALHGARARAARAGGVARAQALDERARLLERAPEVDQRPDLGDEREVALVVVAVAAGPPPRLEQAERLVVPQRPGGHPGPPPQLTDPHAGDAEPRRRREGHTTFRRTARSSDRYRRTRRSSGS